MNLISSSMINNEDYPQVRLNDYKCNQCSKIFTSEYGLNSHITMSHPNQSIFCLDCNLIFRSHRALKNHQQRFHLISSEHFPNYNHLSSYLILPFSTPQFSLLATNACEQNLFPLGELTSKLFQCHICLLSFPCSNSLKNHLLNQHEQYEYEICQTVLYEIILQVEQNSLIVDNDFESMKYLLAKQATYFKLKDKQLQQELCLLKKKNNRLIFPKCEHANRTCANLCLKDLSSYHKSIQNYPYKIPIVSKGNPFSQGSIVSTPIISKEKRIKSSPQIKRTLIFKPQIHDNKINSPDTISSKKTNHSYTRSLSSMSSNSSTSTRSSRQQATTSSLKRSISPTITLAVERSSEKRRRQREQRKTKKTSDDIGQENDDDDDNNSMKSKKPKQRQGSNSSVEYVQIINNNDQQSISSLNNIENYDEDIILCHSPPTVKKKITSDYDETIRVRCKICGDIFEGRSRFSKHVLTMHSHLLNNNLSDIKQQQQKTSIIYSL